jgi:hypothetical protein
MARLIPAQRRAPNGAHVAGAVRANARLKARTSGAQTQRKEDDAMVLRNARCNGVADGIWVGQRVGQRQMGATASGRFTACILITRAAAAVHWHPRAQEGFAAKGRLYCHSFFPKFPTGAPTPLERSRFSDFQQPTAPGGSCHARERMQNSDEERTHTECIPRMAKTADITLPRVPPAPGVTTALHAWPGHGLPQRQHAIGLETALGLPPIAWRANPPPSDCNTNTRLMSWFRSNYACLLWERSQFVMTV